MPPRQSHVSTGLQDRVLLFDRAQTDTNASADRFEVADADHFEVDDAPKPQGVEPPLEMNGQAAGAEASRSSARSSRGTGAALRTTLEAFEIEGADGVARARPARVKTHVTRASLNFLSQNSGPFGALNSGPFGGVKMMGRAETNNFDPGMLLAVDTTPRNSLHSAIFEEEGQDDDEDDDPKGVPSTRRITPGHVGQLTRNGAFKMTSWDNFKFLNLIDDEAIEQACARVFKALHIGKRQCRHELTQAYTFEDKQDALEKLQEEWKKVTAQQFVASLSTLGQDAHQYMSVCTFHMKHEEWNTEPPSYLYHSLRHMRREPSGHIIVSFYNWDQKTGSESDDGTHPWGSTHGKLSLFDKMFDRWKAEYKVHWTSLNNIIDPQETRDQIYIIKALMDTGSTSQVYNTALGRAIQFSAWISIYRAFLFSIFLDFLFLISFFLLSLKLHTHGEPSTFVRVLVAGLTFRNLIEHVFMESYMVLRLYGKAFPLHFCTLRHLSYISLDIYTAIIVFLMIEMNGITPHFFTDFLDDQRSALNISRSRAQDLAGDLPSHHSADFFTRYPYLFAFAIMFRWWDFIMTFLCFHMYGMGLVVMPALHAISTRESLLYLLVSVMAVMGCWQAYWSLPVQPTWEEDNGRNGKDLESFNQISTFLRVFRLVLLADFDLQELEGVDPVVVHGEDGFDVLDEGPAVDSIHLGVQVYFIFTVLIGLVMMNIYIGLLGNLYDEGKVHRHQIHQNLKARHTFWCLLYKHWFPWLPLYTCRSPVRSSKGADGQIAQGCWIAYDQKSHMDDEKLEDRLEHIFTRLGEQDVERRARDAMTGERFMKLQEMFMEQKEQQDLRNETILSQLAQMQAQMRQISRDLKLQKA